MQSFKQIVDAFGIASMAALLRTDESHVRAMKARDSIPPEYWGELIEMAAAAGIKGITFRALRNLRRARFPKHCARRRGSSPNEAIRRSPEAMRRVRW
jgi:hypothetical protein